MQADLLAIAGASVEVMFKATQTVVLDTHRLTLDLTRAVTALVDQHAQHFTGANLIKVSDFARRHMLLGPRRACVGRTDSRQP
ncbi:hypothetical protein D3C76_1413070 [compost metagenome]